MTETGIIIDTSIASNARANSSEWSTIEWVRDLRHLALSLRRDMFTCTYISVENSMKSRFQKCSQACARGNAHDLMTADCSSIDLPSPWHWHRLRHLSKLTFECVEPQRSQNWNSTAFPECSTWHTTGQRRMCISICPAPAAGSSGCCSERRQAAHNITAVAPTQP